MVFPVHPSGGDDQVMSGCPVKKIIGTGLVIAVTAVLVPLGVSCSKPPAPTPAFTVSYISGELLIRDPITATAPLTVQFHDQSSGEISSWRWSLGDGTVIEGSDEESRNPVHTYQQLNNGYRVDLKVTGPGGTDTRTEWGIVAVLSCSESANVELKLAKDAIDACKRAAGKELDSPVTGWDGSQGMVTAGDKDAADYLDVWTTFKAAYDVDQSGTITLGTDMLWDCVFWNASGAMGTARWSALTG